MGFEVTATEDPHDALEAVSRRPFDVAMFDLRMDSMDGLSLTRAALRHQPRLPVLIMTAHGSIDTAVAAIKQGAFDYVTKPFDTAELRRKLDRAIADRRWARDRELLRRLGETLASSSATERTLQAVAQAALEASESERVHVFLVREGQVEPSASTGVASDATSPSPAGAIHAAAERAVADAVPVREEDADGREILATPLVVGGVAHGALVAETRSNVVTTIDDLHTLSLFAGQAAVALKNAQALSRLGSDALAALGRVATQVAHDLNNPLNGLKLQTCVLAERFERAGDESGVSVTQKMERTIDHLAGLVGDILAFGQPRELRREPIDLDLLLEECLASLVERCRSQGVSVEVSTKEVGAPPALDPMEMRRALSNLVQNALDAMPDGGRLEVTARRDGDTLEIVVADDGVGMDEETAARMADLFFTTKKRGTGLGISIVHAAVERHGGSIDVSSAPGRGTRVRLALPL
jgi:signal transduction histidine kinase